LNYLRFILDILGAAEMLHDSTPYID